MTKPRMLMAREDEELYGQLRALLALKKASFVGERYDEDGRKILGVRTNARIAIPNAEEWYGTIGISREFLTAALRDYSDWRETWWREAIQNAVDADAHYVECTVQKNDDDTYTVSCVDDGRGMDEDTLLNKFLRLGGTTKKVLGKTAGGFGKAKELLLMPWLRYIVQSGDLHVDGIPIEQEHKITRVPAIKGTRLTVIMPADQTTWASAAIAFLGKCYLPKIKFVVNGENVKARLKHGELVREFDGANLYYDKRKEVFKERMLIRTGGLYMFDRWVTEGLGGQLIIELTKPSVEVLAANRDNFRDWRLTEQISKFTNQLAKDVKSALKAKKGMIRRKFKGRGKFEAASEDELSSLLFETLGRVEADKHVRGKDELSGAQIEEIKQVLEAIGGGWQPEREIPQGAPGEDEAQGAPPLNFRATGELAEAMLAGLGIGGANQIEAMVKQLSWEPDFFLVNEIEGWKVPQKFFPEKMAPAVRKLLRFWAELCRFVLIQLGSKSKFGVGYIFSPDAGAAYIDEDGEHWLMLNPYAQASGYPAGRILTPSKKDDVPWLYAAAVHECTHMADGVTYHDESFASAFTRNVAKTSGKSRQIEKIRKAVISKMAAEQRVEAKKKKKPVPDWMLDVAMDELWYFTGSGSWASVDELVKSIQYAAWHCAVLDKEPERWEVIDVLAKLKRQEFVEWKRRDKKIRMSDKGWESHRNRLERAHRIAPKGG